MESQELKFILKLLGCKEYRSSISASLFDSFKQEKAKICYSLSDRALVDFDREISSIRITPAGKNVLKMDMTKLPISPLQYKILQVLLKAGGKIVPSQMKGMKNIKVAERDRLIQSLATSGFIVLESGMKKQKCEVWLTQAGLDYLRDEFTGEGTQAVISLNLLTNYLQLMRKYEKLPRVPQNNKLKGDETFKAKVVA